jgi:hypothetical protein
VAVVAGRRRVPVSLVVQRRLMLPLAATAIVLAGQLVEDFNDSPPLQMLPPTLLLPRWTVVVLIAYVFVASAILERVVERSLAAVRPVVEIDDTSFESYEVQMRRLPASTDGALLLLSAVIVLLLFGGLGSDLLIDDPVTHQAQHLPSSPLAAGAVLVGYAIIGWAFFRLVYGTVRLVRLLARLAQEPLLIKVFDTTGLLPFGNIALALALAPAGVIVILVVGLGTPTTLVGWSVLVEATVVILLALLLPLRGIHRQMWMARDAALGTLSDRLADLYAEVTGGLPAEMTEAARMNNATNAVILMRKAVQDMTTWPFRNTAGLARAVLIVSAPLIYTALNEVIRITVERLVP